MDEPRRHFGAERYVSALTKRLGQYFERSAMRGAVLGGPSRGDQALVVGIYGPWGCGKTTWLQSLRDRIARDNQRPRYEGDDQPISLTVPIFFNAWQFEREPHLIVPLLKTAELEVKRTVDISRELAKGAGDETAVATQPFLRWAGRRVGMLWDAALAVGAGLRGSASAKIPGGVADAKIEFDLGKARAEYEKRRAGREPSAPRPSALDAYESIYYNLRAYMETLTGRSTNTPDALEWLARVATEIEDRLLRDDAELELDEHELEILEWWNRRSARQATEAEPEPKAEPEKVEHYRLNLLFLIDDLDRCLPEKAVELLESIKLFLEVPGCAFVLAVDDEVVERGIRHRYKDYLGDGELQRRAPVTGAEYLEKIIHLPVRVPPLSRGEARAFLQAEYGLDDAVLKLFERCVPPVPRKLIRAAEVFGLLDELARKQVAEQTFGCEKYEPLLLARLVLLQLFAPELYRLGGRPRGRGFLQDLKQIRAARVDDEIRRLRSTLDINLADEAGAGAGQNPNNGLGQRKLDEQRLRVAVEVRSVLELRSGFDPCEAVDDEDYDWDSRVAAHYRLIPEPSGVESAATSSDGPTRSASRAGVYGQPLDLEAFVDLIFTDDPETWRRALAEEHEQLRGRAFSSATVERIVERAEVGGRTTLGWLAWIEAFSGYFRPAELARLCREVKLLVQANDPALVVSRLCRILNPPHAAVSGFLEVEVDRGDIAQIVLRDYLATENGDALDRADFSGCYLVGLDGRGVQLPRSAEAWTGADLRFADLEPEVDTRLALCEVGRLHTLELPVACGGGLNVVRLASGDIVSSHRDRSLRVWSPAGPLTATLWTGARSSSISAWGDAIASLSGSGLERLTLDGERRTSSVEKAHPLWFSAICELPDGNLAVGGGDGFVKIVEPNSLNSIGELRTGRARVTSLRVYGDSLVWSAYDGSIGVHPLGEGERKIMRGEDGQRVDIVTPLASGEIATASKDGLVRIWSVEGTNTASFENGASVSAFTEVSGQLVVGDGMARIRLRTDRGVENLASVNHCAWDLLALDSRQILCVAERRLQVWTIAGERRREVRDATGLVLASIDDNVVAWADADNHVWCLRMEGNDDTELSSIEARGRPSLLRADGDRILVSGDYQQLRSWSGEPHGSLVQEWTPTHTEKITALVRRADGLVAGTHSGRVMLLQPPKWGHQGSTDDANTDVFENGAHGQVDAMAVSPDGAKLAVAFRGGVIKVEGQDDGLEIGGQIQQVKCLCWLADGTLVAGHREGLTHIAEESGECSDEVRKELSCLARGRVYALIAGDADGFVYLWTDLGVSPHRFQAHHHEILAVHERPDGGLVTVAFDGVRFWSPERALREQLTVLSRTVVMRIRPDADWPIAIETLESGWRYGFGGQPTDEELDRWVGAFVSDARRSGDPDAPLVRVPLNGVSSEAWRWGTSVGSSGRSVLELRWPEDPDARRALQYGLLGLPP